jgi:hypothetical protein
MPTKPPHTELNAAAIAANSTVGPASTPDPSKSKQAHSAFRYLTTALAYTLPQAIKDANRSGARLRGMARGR